MREIDSGRTIGEVARPLELSPKLLERRRGEWRARGEPAFPGSGRRGQSQGFTQLQRTAELERKIGRLTMENDFLKKLCSMAIEVDTSLGGARVRRVLERVAGERGRPEAILSDNGPEFPSRAVETWALQAKVRRDRTRQGFAAPRPVGAPLTEPAPPPKNDRLRGRCPSDDSPGSSGPNPDPSHSNWIIPRG